VLYALPISPFEIISFSKIVSICGAVIPTRWFTVPLTIFEIFLWLVWLKTVGMSLTGPSLSWIDVVRAFHQYLHPNDSIAISIRLRPVPSTSFSFHFPLLSSNSMLYNVWSWERR
jgi:hypothetical protein